MTNKIKEFLSKNACAECDYYNKNNNVCQSKKVQMCGSNPYASWFDKHFCEPHKAESEDKK